MRFVALLAFTLIASAASAQEGPFLFDVLLKPAYRGGWEKLMKQVQPTPDWLMEFSKNFDGVAGPMKPATIGGKTYELYFVCKPHDCAAKKFEVMFEASTRNAPMARLAATARRPSSTATRRPKCRMRWPRRSRAEAPLGARQSPLRRAAIDVCVLNA